MEDSDEFKWAVKVVIKQQMRDLMEQLRERGEEIAILTVNLDDNTCSHFGSPSGEWFVTEQKNLAQNFLKFCKVKGKKGSHSADTGISSVSYSSPKTSTVIQQTRNFADGPSLTVTVPRKLAGDVTEEELAFLVGRIVASQLAVQEKGAGFKSCTKFDLLVEAAIQAKKNQGTSSVLSTPSTRSTRKRKMSQKYREGISSLKKGKKSEDDYTRSEYESGQDDGYVLINMLAELNTNILKRVKVKTSEEEPVHIEKSTLENSDKLENLAVLLIKEIDEMACGLLNKEKLVQVTVILDEANTYSKVTIEVEGMSIERIKNEEMDDSDMEYFDLDELIDEGEDEEDSMIAADPVFEPSLRRPKISNKNERDGNSCKVRDTTPQTVKRKKPKYKKPLSETMPTPCEHCGMILTGKSSLNAHIKRVHLNQRDKKCTICGKGFCTSTARESHMLSVHTRRCEACQEYVVESVPWSSGMDMRMKRDVICTCGAIVSIYSSFGRKRQYYRDDEPDEDGNFPEPEPKRDSNTGMKYACSVCGKMFRKRANCRLHARIHTNYKGVECEICGNYFSHKSSLKSHLLTHDTTKHECEICGKNYSNEQALKIHYKKNHSEGNITIGRKVVTIVNKKGNDTHDLEQRMAEKEEKQDLNEVGNQYNGQTTQVAESKSLSMQESGQVVVTEGEDSMQEQGQVVVTQGEDSMQGSGQVVVTQGEDGQMTLSIESGQLLDDTEAARIVQQVIHNVAKDGNMSIIIKTINN